LLNPAHLHLFTYQAFFKLLLDAGFAPSIADTIEIPCPKPFLDAVEPLLHYLGLDFCRMQRYLSACHYILKGRALPYYNRHRSSENAAVPTSLEEPPLSFVVCVSNDATLKCNLLASPGLGQGSPHELLVMRGCRSAAEGLNRGLARARHPLVVCVHQDVYLPAGWPARFWQQYRVAQERYKNVGVLGVYGVSYSNGHIIKTGKVVDRDRLLEAGDSLPAPVETLDELLVAVPKDARLQFDPQLGFHFYGADICLAAREQGLQALAVDALCFHNSPHAGLPTEFFASARTFAAKWRREWPVATSCALIDQQGTIHAP
jgi:hypothetical protein